jgi:CSLREA domain-containing protein
VTTLDDNDAGTTCTASDPHCTLREAIGAANNVTGSDTIRFDAGLSGTIVLNSGFGELSVSDSVNIADTFSPGNIAVSGNNASRVFKVENTTSAITVTLDTLTIRDGKAGANGTSLQGGGIYNAENLTISNSRSTTSACIVLHPAVH